MELSGIFGSFVQELEKSQQRGGTIENAIEAYEVNKI